MANKEDKLGSLWVNKEKGYMSGTINGERVIIFKNGFKQADIQPDYIVYKSKPKEENASVQPANDGFMPVVDGTQLPF